MKEPLYPDLLKKELLTPTKPKEVEVGQVWKWLEAGNYYIVVLHEKGEYRLINLFRGTYKSSDSLWGNSSSNDFEYIGEASEIVRVKGDKKWLKNF